MDTDENVTDFARLSALHVILDSGIYVIARAVRTVLASSLTAYF